MSGPTTVFRSAYIARRNTSYRPLRVSVWKVRPDLMMMADCLGFHAQIGSIIEILANSAVVEICKLVEDGYAALRAQMEEEREKSKKENDSLRQKLHEMDVKMRGYGRKIRRRSQREEAYDVHFEPVTVPEEQQSLPLHPAPSEDASLNVLQCNAINKEGQKITSAETFLQC